jgi:hypothetical protein
MIRRLVQLGESQEEEEEVGLLLARMGAVSGDSRAGFVASTLQVDLIALAMRIFIRMRLVCNFRVFFS